jgi:hypothetical protein
MRHPFQAQPELQITPIEKIRLPLQSRDELPPILAGLQWIWMHPTLKTEIFALLEAKILAGKQATGRTGMDLWQILVLGVVRLGLDADWDRMEHVANYDFLVRQMLGVPVAPWGEEDKRFGHQTLRDNVALLDDELLQQINARVAAAGREVFAKKAGAPLAALEVKVDSYVLETDVHFPTDLNLLWDAGRKCVDLIEGFRAAGYALPGWRKAKDWRRQLKNLQRTTSQIVYRGGPNKEARVQSAVREYLAVGRALAAKVQPSLLELCDLAVDAPRWERLAYFHAMLDKHLDLVARRLLHEETIPAHEKVFSLFEPHTEWIQKATPERGTGAQAPARHRSAAIDSGLRRVAGGSRNGSKHPGDGPAAGTLRRRQRGQCQFRQRLYADGGSGVTESVCAHRGDAQAREEERGRNGAGERPEVCGAAPPTQRGGKRDQQSGTPRIEPLSGRGDPRLPKVCGLRRAEL